MAADEFKRRLTAILSADVEGYSRLMREDEEATVRTLTNYRTAIVHLIEQYRGRVVDSPGDNILAEFTSVVDAVNCGVEIQRELAERNAELPENRRMQFRIGINLGDILEEGERIYGDGVNIAARMESLAVAGEICISGTVYDAIENKIGLEYEYLGEHEVKNIDKPIRAYRVLSYPGAAAHRVLKAKKAVGKTWRNAIMAIVVVLVLGAATAFWHFYFRPPPIEPASKEKMAYPLPDKPSIAVLPFDNMSRDPEQDYIADGISENIITALSYIPEMFVIARNSSFTYKGKPVKVHQVSEELGVRYILEGSVLKSGDKVRVTAQLIDALSGGHIWSERFDRDFKDLFKLLDEITQAITVALQVKLTHGEQARMWYDSTSNFEAWGYAVKGLDIFYHYTKEGNAKARAFFEKALEIDSEYAHALTMLAWTHYIDARHGFTDSRDESFTRTVELAEKAVALDDKDPLVHSLWQHIYLMKRQHDKAVEEGRKAIALGPNDAEVHTLFGEALSCSGFFEEAVQMCEKAMRLHPHTPIYYFGNMMMAYYRAGRYDETLNMAERLIDRAQKVEYPGGVVWGYLGSAHAHIKLGQESEARKEVAEALKIWPWFNLEWDRRYSFTKPAIMQQEQDDLRKAGVPEHAPLPLPDKPSIAVLPFVNMSGDPKQEYLSDGITEQIITSISKLPRLFVIARTSSFKYKGKAVDVQQVARELGVKYVLEGSVQRSGDRLRITAQLIDAIRGKHLWAERYDRDFKDLFDLQDEITMKIMGSLAVKLTEGERLRLGRTSTDNLKALEKLLEATPYIRAFNIESNATARQLYEEAIALDPEFAGAYDALAATHFMDVHLGSSKSPRKSLEQATKLLHKAIALYEHYASAHSHLCHIYGMQRQYEKAIVEGEKAVALNPNSDSALMWLGMTMDWVGRSEEAIALYKKAMRLSPFPPGFYYLQLGHAYRSTERYKEAITEYKKTLHLTPRNVFAFSSLAICYSLLGQEEEARAAAAELLRINPKFSLEGWTKKLFYKDQALKERWCDALRKAGLK